MLDVRQLALEGVRILIPKRFGDRRGFFSESYNRNVFAEAGIGMEFVQDNHSRSVEKGTIRGLHFQVAPKLQAKLVRVARGSIFDVVVDVRRSSPAFGKWVGAEITAEHGEQMFVPAGYAHGFCTLEPETEVLYKVSDYYSPEHEVGIAWNDPEIGIRWPLEGNPVLSAKDERNGLLKDSPCLP